MVREGFLEEMAFKLQFECQAGTSYEKVREQKKQKLKVWNELCGLRDRRRPGA